MDKVLVEAKVALKPIIFRSLMPHTPKWDNFISHLDFQFNNTNYPHKVDTGPIPQMVNGVLIKDALYVAPFQSTEEFYPQLTEVFSKLKEMYGETHDNAFSLISFAGGQKPIYIHFDRRDSFYWQCIGSVIWEIYETRDPSSLIERITVNQGDVLFVPEGMNHSIVAPEPRAAISICFNSGTVF